LEVHSEPGEISFGVPDWRLYFGTIPPDKIKFPRESRAIK
jgi:hypothetical protein